MQEMLIFMLVLTLFYRMQNPLGYLTKFSVFGMMVYALYNTPGWDNKLFVIAMLSIPVIIDVGIKLLKLKLIKV